MVIPLLCSCRHFPWPGLTYNDERKEELVKAFLLTLSMALLLAGCGGEVTAVPAATPGPSATATAAPIPTLSQEELQLAAMVLETTGDVAPVHDVTMIKDGETYYLFSTGPGIPIRCSEDMLVWRSCGRVFESYPEWIGQTIPKVKDLWAPDVVVHEGTYYVYYSASSFGKNRSAIGLVSNVTLNQESPDYTWVDQGEVISSQLTDNYNAIDPNLTFDTTAQPWFLFGSFWGGIMMAKADRATLKLAAGSELTNIAARPDHPNHALEGAYIVHRGDFYYLFISHDFCCKGVMSTYNIKVGRSKDITGPYVDRDGTSLTEGGGTQVYKGSGPWRGPGHNSVYVENDEYFMVYHAYSATTAGTPTLRIEKLAWDDEGWPVSPSALLGR